MAFSLLFSLVMRIGLTTLALCFTLTTSATAYADGWYFTEGFGGAELEDELGEHLDGNFSFRVSLGRRFDRWALEAFMTATMLTADNTENDLLGYGLSARYMVPLHKNIEVYVRGGLHKNHLHLYGDWENEQPFSGRAIHYGAGIHLKGKVPALGFLFSPLFFTNIGPKVTASLWLETNQQFTRLHQEGRSSIDASLSSVLVGFGIGSDF